MAMAMEREIVMLMELGMGMWLLMSRYMNVAFPLPYRLFSTSALAEPLRNSSTVCLNTLCPAFSSSDASFLLVRNGVSLSITG